MLCALYKVSVGAAHTYLRDALRTTKLSDHRRLRYLNSQSLLTSFPIDNQRLVRETIWHNVLLAVTVLREFPVL